MSEVQKYRKKPVVIEAIQFDEANYPTIRDWVGPRYDGDPFERDGFIPSDEQWVNPPQDVTALIWDKLHDTWVGVKKGQWIIKGVQGEFYPCDPDVFATTYAQEDTAWPERERILSVCAERGLIGRDAESAVDAYLAGHKHDADGIRVTRILEMAAGGY